MKQPANTEALLGWTKAHCPEKNILAAMDMLAYGGLIPSRLGQETLGALQERTETFLATFKSPYVSVFSSILRIPHYNNDEEEPPYWQQYGQDLYQYSVDLHQHPESATTQVPDAILNDFLNRRARNFKFNQWLLTALENQQFQYLTFCQDDTGAYGLNVKEAEQLKSAISMAKLSHKAHIQTGADEVACVQLARCFSELLKTHPKIHPIYSHPTGEKILAKFDGLPIGTVVDNAIRAAGAGVCPKAEAADLILLVHTPARQHGDHADCIPAEGIPQEQIQTVITSANTSQKPIILVDVAYANGSDPQLTKALLDSALDFKTLYGYAGWNTPGNAIGTSIAMGIVRFLAEKQQSFNATVFHELLLIRFSDDAVYQADVRQRLRNSDTPLNTDLLNQWMTEATMPFQERLGLLNRRLQFSFPCQRTFEVAVNL